MDADKIDCLTEGVIGAVFEVSNTLGAGFLEEERRALGERWFRQEYLREFLEADDVLFRREVVEGAITEDRRWLGCRPLAPGFPRGCEIQRH